MIGEAVNRPTMVTKRIIMFQVSFNLSMMMMLNVFSTSRRLPAAVVALPTVFLAARQLSYNSTTHTHTPTHTQHTHTVRRHVWPVPAAALFFSASNLRFRSLPPILNRPKERGHTSDLFVCSTPIHCWITSCCSIEKTHQSQMIFVIYFNCNLIHFKKKI